MEIEDIRRHWTNWATTYGGALRATTKTWTLKALEQDALCRRMRLILGQHTSGHVLEMGCGNGINCIELANVFPHMHFDGADIIPEMVQAAIENGEKSQAKERVRFFK